VHCRHHACILATQCKEKRLNEWRDNSILSKTKLETPTSIIPSGIHVAQIPTVLLFVLSVRFIISDDGSFYSRPNQMWDLCSLSRMLLSTDTCLRWHVIVLQVFADIFSVLHAPTDGLTKPFFTSYFPFSARAYLFFSKQVGKELPINLALKGCFIIYKENTKRKNYHENIS